MKCLKLILLKTLQTTFFSVFGTSWQFGGTFTSRGGVLQAKGSDISLVVVPNAIPKGDYVDVYGAIFTDVSEIRKKVRNLCNNFAVCSYSPHIAIPTLRLQYPSSSPRF